MKLYIKASRDMSNSEAYMLDKKGHDIWVDVHPYGSTLFPEANASAALFLVTNDGQNTERYIEFLHQYMARVLIQSMEEDELADIQGSEFGSVLEYALLKYGRSKTAYLLAEYAGYHTNNDKAASVLMQLYDRRYYINGQEVLAFYDPNDKGNDICTELNQEYARIRIGGMYESVGDSTYYCRIGSRGFDWGSVVKKHIRRFARDVQYVTIERDRESDHGPTAVFDKSIPYRAYTTEDGTPIISMPIQEFLYEHDTPILSSYSPERTMIYGASELLCNGGSYLEFLGQGPSSIMEGFYRKMLDKELENLVAFDDT